MPNLFENVKVGDFVKLNPTIGSDSKRKVVTVTPEGFNLGTEDSFYDLKGNKRGKAYFFNLDVHPWTEEDEAVWQFNKGVAEVKGKLERLFSKLSLLRYQEGYNEEVFNSMNAHLELLTQTLEEDLYNDPK